MVLLMLFSFSVIHRTNRCFIEFGYYSSFTMAEGLDEFNDLAAWGEWNGDEDDDEDFDMLLYQTTQIVEQEEERKLNELRTQTRTRGIGSGDGPTMTPKVAAHAFDLRRENLPPPESNGYSMLDPLSSTSQDYSRYPEEAANKIRHITQLYATERSKTFKQGNELLAEKGQCTNLRRQLEALKQQQLEDQFNRMQKERLDKKRLDEEKKQAMQNFKSLQTELRIANNQIAKERAKSAMLNASNRSVGGALSQNHSRGELNLSKTMHQSPPVTPKHRSDPYLNTPTQQMSWMNRSEAATTPPAVGTTTTITIQTGNQPIKVDVEEKGFQINATVEEQQARTKEVFTGERGEEEAHVNKLEDEECLYTVEEIRTKIHATLQRLIHREYDVNVKSLLKEFAAAAPVEIMARYTRGIELKTHFPDLIENMFLYGIQEKRKKESQDRGEFNQKNYPKLPNSKNPEIIDLPMLEDKLEGCFINSAWEALAEVKRQLTNFLSTLSGNIRFRLYEYQNLETLWKLLSWAKYLWRFVIFEEEFDEIVKAYPTWKDELQAWTGLVLKMAWRDFYILELEQLVREFCLDILEIIVTSGYFDSSQRRYEILYCILKDTLVKDHLRDEKALIKTLNIISWSVGDNRNILNYLCMNKNDTNCLARILGEQVVKCFKETDCPKKATALLLHYFHLLETLMVASPLEFFSKIARGPDQAETAEAVDLETQDPTNDNSCLKKYINDNSENMDADADVMMCTQFACPDKYKFEEGTKERAKQFNKVEAASCWISPREWEVKMGDNTNKTPEGSPCQCRKILLGNAFLMMYQLVPWWRQAQVKRENLTELMQTLAYQEKRDLDEDIRQPWSPEWKENLTKHLNSLTDFILNKLADNFGDDEPQKTLQIEEADAELEIPWDIFLKNWNVPERLFVDSRRIKGTIFDFAVQSGLLFMNFCNFYSDNIALAVGSEPFNDFNLMVSAANMRAKNPWIKEAQIRFLTEIIRSGEDDEDEPVQENSEVFSDSYDSGDSYDSNKMKFAVNDPIEKFTKASMQGFPPVQQRPKIQIKENEFDVAFRAKERENREYWDNWDSD